MFEQLTQLVQQFGQDAVVKNNAVPNEHNEAVMNEASSSIMGSLKNMAAQGNVSDLAGLFQGNNASDTSNPVVQKITEQLSGNLGEKFGMSSDDASGVAGNLIPKVLGSLVGNAKDPNHKGFEVSDIVNAISGGSGNSGLMDAVSKYGGQFGLDQNADGKVDMSDAMAAVSKKGGIGGLLGKLFGK
ncbi:hypothetical protein [Flavobacterium sp.]|uniref:hypothetical protein n=1 Tax=Flavobacterium sp. TaxID=239 RepID=UPI0026100F2F|nr:hypothetical protein [Flavobacterium sp.]